jgi:hypothetical protein
MVATKRRVGVGRSYPVKDARATEFNIVMLTPVEKFQNRQYGMPTQIIVCNSIFLDKG